MVTKLEVCLFCLEAVGHTGIYIQEGAGPDWMEGDL